MYTMSVHIMKKKKNTNIYTQNQMKINKVHTIIAGHNKNNKLVNLVLINRAFALRVSKTKTCKYKLRKSYFQVVGPDQRR